jgi:hypothetical protein
MLAMTGDLLVSHVNAAKLQPLCRLVARRSMAAPASSGAAEGARARRSSPRGGVQQHGVDGETGRDVSIHLRGVEQPEGRRRRRSSFGVSRLVERRAMTIHVAETDGVAVSMSTSRMGLGIFL